MDSGYGIGFYSFPDAARFLGAKASDLRRWLIGYSYRASEGETAYSPPLWPRQHAGTGVDGIGFRDLVELRFVKVFRDAGVPLQIIRKTLEVAGEEFGADYPLTCRRFRTDGERIFVDVLEATGETSLVDVCRKQHVFRKVIGPSLREDVEFDAVGKAARWYPLDGSKAVVFDPARRFGQPILTDSGVPTIAIANALRAEGGDLARVARLYEITVAAVRKAAAFERQALAAA